MSKKNKKKFKANLQEMLGQIEKEEKLSKISAIEEQTPEKENKLSEDAQNDKYIKHDVFKIVYGLAACFVVLVIVWYLDAHTDIINNFSNNLANILRIGK